MTDSKRKNEKRPAGSKTRQDRIGNQLRKLYDDVASEPIPDDFMKLLESADDASQSDSQDNS